MTGMRTGWTNPGEDDPRDAHYVIGGYPTCRRMLSWYPGTLTRLPPAWAVICTECETLHAGPLAQARARAEWEASQVLAALGLSVDERGTYVSWGKRCAPGLGWPLSARSARLELSMDEHHQVLSGGIIVRRIGRRT